LRLFILSGRHFQFSPQSVQLIVKLGQPGLTIYSYRRATIGSTFVARRAGR